MKKKSTSLRKYEAPVAVAFVIVGVLLAYLVTSFTYGQDPDDGVIDFSMPTRTALANAAATDASGTQTNFGTKAAGIFSLFDSSPTPTLSRTATPTLTPTRTSGITEQPTRRKREDPPTATPRPTNTKPPPPTATKKPNPTRTGTAASGSFSLQGSSANLAGSAISSGAWTAGELPRSTRSAYLSELRLREDGGESREEGSCSSYLCRLIALIFLPGGW